MMDDIFRALVKALEPFPLLQLALLIVTFVLGILLLTKGLRQSSPNDLRETKLLLEQLIEDVNQQSARFDNTIRDLGRDVANLRSQLDVILERLTTIGPPRRR